jgi:hypothetical protein
MTDRTNWFSGPLHDFNSLTMIGNKFGLTARTTISQISKTLAVRWREITNQYVYDKRQSIGSYCCHWWGHCIPIFSKHLECHHLERWPKSDWVSEDLRHQNKKKQLMNIDDRHIHILRSNLYWKLYLPAEIIPFPKACAILPAPMKPTLADDKSILIFYQTSVECVSKKTPTTVNSPTRLVQTSAHLTESKVDSKISRWRHIFNEEK